MKGPVPSTRAEQGTPLSVAGAACVPCHSSQAPDLPQMSYQLRPGTRSLFYSVGTTVTDAKGCPTQKWDKN